MHKPESVLENRKHKKDHNGPTIRPYNKKKRTCWIVNFLVPAEHRVKLKESEKKDKYLYDTGELKKISMEHECKDYTNCNWCSWYSYQRINKGTRGLWNMRASEDHPNYCNEISQNSEKCSGDLRRLSVTQTRVSDHQLTLTWKSDVKNSQGVKNNTSTKPEEKIKYLMYMGDTKITIETEKN